mgnify:FL=1|jgi:hypothetical protein
MEEMGWSWRDIETTPFVVLDEVYERLVLRAKWAKIKKEMEDNVNSQFGS